MNLALPELKRIARVFVRRSMRIGRKASGSYDAVRILYNRTDPSCERFAELVEEECWRAGAHTLTLRYASARERLWYLLKPKSSLKELSPFAEAIARKADVTIFIGEDDDPNWARGLSSRIRLTAPIRQRIREILDRRRVRWAYFGWPVPGAARSYGCDVGFFRKVFFDSIRQTFSGPVRKLCARYARALRGSREIQIRSPDTHLRFRITGRPILVDDGFLSDEDIRKGDVGVNIPAGEVFVAPLECSADGTIAFDKVAIPGFGRVVGARLVFKHGRVVSIRARKGADRFKKFLRANTGDKDRIAEFGIGTNPGARYTGGSIIIDEKIFGTIHIAIGNNRGAYHGRNRASCHLDMIKDMSEGEVIADGTVIMKDGKPV
jgi:aminopeptidase